MGRAFTAVPGDAESLLYNPAGPGLAARSSVYLAYMNGFADGRYGLAALPLRLGPLTLTPAYLYYDSGKITLNLSDGTQETVTAELDKVAMISGAYSPAAGLAVGGTLKFTTIALAETASASASHYDLGILYRMASGLSFGAASLNHGDYIKFEEEGDPAPVTTRAGVSYKTEFRPELIGSPDDISYSDIVLSADWSRTAKESSCYQAGAEVNMEMSVGVMLSLRGGYLFDRDDEGMTLGVGVRKNEWNFGVGYETSKNLSPRFPVSLSLEF